MKKRKQIDRFHAPPPTEGTLRVWWIPQIPGDPFYIPVRNIREAKLILDTLAFYDLFQFENNIKPDYYNAGSLEVFKDEAWTDWFDEESGDDFDDLERNNPERFAELVG